MKLKGVWLFDIGSNPYSNGDDFSRSLIIFVEIKKLINIIVKEVIISKKIIIDNWIIIYTKYIRFFNWKLNTAEELNVTYHFPYFLSLWIICNVGVN